MATPKSKKTPRRYGRGGDTGPYFEAGTQPRSHKNVLQSTLPKGSTARSMNPRARLAAALRKPGLSPSKKASLRVELRNSPLIKRGSPTMPRKAAPSLQPGGPSNTAPGSSRSTVSRAIGIPGLGGLDQMRMNTQAISKALGGRKAIKKGPPSSRPRNKAITKAATKKPSVGRVRR